MDEKSGFSQSKQPYSKMEEEGVQIIDVEKPMGLFGATSFLFCSMIGTGIFISVSETFNVLSSNNVLVVLLIWIFGGLISLVGALCYAELGSRFPQTGGECVYFGEILGEKFGVLFVIMYVFVVKAITLAALSLTAAKYLVNSFGFTDPLFIDKCTKTVALSVLLITFLVNCFSRSTITKFLNVFSLLKLASMTLIICTGLYSMIKGNARELRTPVDFKGFDFLKLASALVSICWCFEGWNSLGMKAGDVRNPSRNLIGSSVIGVFLVSLTYVLCVLSYLAVLGFDTVRVSETVALSLAKIQLGKAYPVLSILICMSAIGSTICNLYAIGGVVTYAGYKGIVPSVFSLVHKTTQVPYVATLTITLISSAFVFVKFKVLLNYCSFISWFFYFLSFTCLWVLKVKYGAYNPKTFSVNYVFVLFSQLVCVSVIFVCFYSYFYGCLMVAALMLSIFFIQYLPCKISEESLIARMYHRYQKYLMRVFNLRMASSEDVQ